MTNPKRVKKAFVWDQKSGAYKEVGPGDWVAIMPADVRVAIGQDDEFFAQDSVDSLRDFIGVNPSFEIAWIGRWPCGRDMLYRKDDEDGEPGCHASEFVTIQP